MAACSHVRRLVLAGLVGLFVGSSVAVTTTLPRRQAQSDGNGVKASKVLFMCPHGAAKSVLASAYFQHRAKERGLNIRVDSAGTEPDATVDAAVAKHLAENGYDVPIAKPREVTRDDLATADIVVSMGCDLDGLPEPRGSLLKWDDVPGPSEDLAGSDEAIRRRVDELIDELDTAAAAQEVPEEYEAVLTTLGKEGDFSDGVLKVNIPRNDLSVTIRERPAPTPFGFGGWVAFAKGEGDVDVMMGDLVLTEDEVNPVMSAVLDNGLQVTALHNHFFWEQPRVFYMHVHGRGRAADLAGNLKPAIELIGQASRGAAAPTTSAEAGALDAASLAQIIGHEGAEAGPVYKITIGRPDIDVREHGARINARMGLNTWAAFVGTDDDAMVAGDVAMLESEVTAVLKALREHGIDIVAIHHHMTDVKPVVIFLHYFGTGSAAKLARGVRAAVDELSNHP